MDYSELYFFPAIISVVLIALIYAGLPKPGHSAKKLARIKIPVSNSRRRQMPVQEEESSGIDLPGWFLWLVLIVSVIPIVDILVQR